jgi:hypothetical protein
MRLRAWVDDEACRATIDAAARLTALKQSC